MGVVHKSRLALIELGKSLPFIICAIVCVSYLENGYALYTCDFLEFTDGVYLNKPVSWFIGQYFELDLPTLSVLAILSFAIRTCVFNKLAIAYLAIQLFEKSYFQSHEWANYELYYLVSAVNVVVCLFFVFKGIQRIIKH